MPTAFKKIFFAYPEQPTVVADSIRRATTAANTSAKTEITPWEALSVLGAYVPDLLRDNLREADCVVCDMTHPNHNVFYEFGFAIGAGKPVAPVINISIKDAEKHVQADGFLDGIGYQKYENSKDLENILLRLPDQSLLQLYERPINIQQPLYFLDSQRKTDFRNAIVSTIKDSGVFFRSFDPVETARFSIVPLIGEVSSSSSVIVPLVATTVADSDRHNLRAAVLAGLAHGLNRETLLIQRDYGAVPFDYRENVVSIASEDDAVKAVSDFTRIAALAIQSIPKPKSRRASRSALQQISLGATNAENEFRTLGNYFVKTHEYMRALRGEARIISGRKGSGKTAIFYQVRDTVRQDKRGTVIADLKPESHQLSLFREELLAVADAGVFDHTLASFWYYVALTEILIQIKRSLARQTSRKQGALAQLRKVEDVMSTFDISESGDFTTRITRLGSLIVQELRASKARGEPLSTKKLTNIVFRSGIPEIRSLIHETVSDKVLFLFDNIDKGWPARGVHEFDIRLVRLLIESLEKVQHDLNSDGVDFQPIVFLRNDIYELLVEQTPDRGKAGQIRIDWTDRAKLRQVIFERLLDNEAAKDHDFESLWSKYFTGKIKERDSFEYCLDHCLMRPRFLISIIENVIANAVNRGHVIADSEDFIDAVRQHSLYLVNDFGYEIRDVSGLPHDILYSLVGVTELLTRDETIEKFESFGVTGDNARSAFDLMLWYGVIGLAVDDQRKLYIYDFDYDIRRLEAEIRTRGSDTLYVVNPALHIGLKH